MNSPYVLTISGAPSVTTGKKIRDSAPRRLMASGAPPAGTAMISTPSGDNVSKRAGRSVTDGEGEVRRHDRWACRFDHGAEATRGLRGAERAEIVHQAPALL